MKTKNMNGVDYEIETHDFGKKLSDIKIPKGWRLWTAWETLFLYEYNAKKFNLLDCYFFVKQSRKNTTDVARFIADSGRAVLDCYRYPSGAYSSLGVRFCRDIKKVKK